MKASRAAVKQIKTVEELSDLVQAQSERLASVEAKVDALIALLKAQAEPKAKATK